MWREPPGDVLEEQVMLEGISLRMMDTAGIRETSTLR